jgi:Rrf2 family protein
MAMLLGASEAHLSKVLQDLARGGLVHSTRGPKGGFSLAKAAEEVSLLEVYEAIEGPIQSGSCVSLHRPSFCLGEKCILGDLVSDITKQFRDYLSGALLGSLAGALDMVKAAR